ncbi:hypothetical protein HXX76_014280 [Chlamydomonas incerta]|uniref:Protein kinase domain-containing protein n=1 Tax=Chlamydomonas incerta TaxID=51695 RepID=A0A835SD09_CHLIN|nr:hypothetical protein HXX76_014280 [Chlamydomonas incerta]|eukprot:KAG2424704.1 hypothetical protein HXX76_014280 [Chlamydomonas incerta]
MPADKLLGDLRATDLQGSGSMGTVYRGMYRSAPAALKIMFSEVPMLTPTTAKELTVAMHLRHPNIVSTFTTRSAILTQESLACLGDGGASAGTPTQQVDRHDHALSWAEIFRRGGAAPGHTVTIIVQELCDSGTLADAIATGIFAPRPGWTPALIRRVVLRTAADVCRGMIHMHACGVLHGDLKPANVLLARSGKDRRGFEAKVADFGLSRILLDAAASWVQSSPQGTCRYMPPEAFRGAFHRASDVYAFGMVLFDLAFSRRPYPHLNNVQIMMGVTEGTLQPDWPDAEWPELCALGRRCTAREPRARPSFAELEAELVALEAAVRDADARERSQQQQPSHGGALLHSEQKQQQEEHQSEASALAREGVPAAVARGLKPPHSLPPSSARLPLWQPLTSPMRREGDGNPTIAAGLAIDGGSGDRIRSGTGSAAARAIACGVISAPLSSSIARTTGAAIATTANFTAAAMARSEGTSSQLCPTTTTALHAAAIALLFVDAALVDATPRPREEQTT